MQITSRSYARSAVAVLIPFGALAVVALLASLMLPLAPAQAAGSLGVSVWEAGTCTGSESSVPTECKYSNPGAFYTQAAGHPPWGLTGFELSNSGAAPNGSALKRLRVDVPPGLAADPEALAVCSRAQFNANACPASAKAGFVSLKAYVEIPLVPQTLTLKGNVYNLPQEPGLPLVFGIDVEGVQPLTEDVHLLLEGHVSYAHEDSLAARGVPSGDFHEWFEINNIPTEVGIKVLGLEVDKAPLKTVESKLFFNGHAGTGGKENFLTMPSSCSAPSTSYLELETYGPVEKTSLATTPPVKVEHCDKVPFAPTATIKPETSQYESPDGITTDVHVPQFEKSSQINTADINDAHITLPEGLTLNPAAVNGLQACKQSQLHRGSSAPVECPAASKIGTVNIETDLPPGSLAGNVYLGQEDGTAAITGLPHPFLIFIDAESVYNVSVRLEGQALPNATTGRLEVSFLGNPQLPFSDLTLTLNGGPRAPLANPQSCAAASTGFAFSAYTGGSFGGSTPFSVSGCPASTPFALAQSTATSSPKAGAYTGYTFNLARPDGNQYLGKVSTVLPAGLVGEIPKVTLCGEPQAAAGTCGTASQIGTATAAVGAGSEPYPFTGPVFLTGPYQGAPYGLSIPIHAAAGPFDLGNVVTHATINVDPHSARVIVTTTDLPSIFKGVPLRLRNITVAVNRSNFLFNPTNCGPLSTDTTLTSTFGATQGGLSSPFSVGNCSALAFKPNFSAASSASTDPTQLKANGASLHVNLLQGLHEANIRSVVAELPKSLPSRLTTLQKACPEATYAASPSSCPSGSKVGSATVTTPVLPQPLKGPAYLVSHGGAAFPDLDLLLEGDGGVRVILVGNTDIKNGITKSTFASIPDVPVSSFVLDLPQGANSVLTAIGGGLCSQSLLMPTTITAQSGAVIKQSTNVGVEGCTGKGKGTTRFKILSKKIVKNKLVVRVQTFAPGRVSLKNRFLRTTYKHFAKAGKFTIKAPLSRKGIKAERARKLKFKARVGFYPKSKREDISVAFTNVGFRHKAKKGKGKKR
jgi:hypothetical protein